jgi:hypothetical protein
MSRQPRFGGPVAPWNDADRSHTGAAEQIRSGMALRFARGIAPRCDVKADRGFVGLNL